MIDTNYHFIMNLRQGQIESVQMFSWYCKKSELLCCENVASSIAVKRICWSFLHLCGRKKQISRWYKDNISQKPPSWSEYKECTIIWSNLASEKHSFVFFALLNYTFSSLYLDFLLYKPSNLIKLYLCPQLLSILRFSSIDAICTAH